MDTPATPGNPGHRDPAPTLDFTDPLSLPPADETDHGWGEGTGSGGGAADLARFLDEKPPHHF
ncbi:hypothetical protein GCM10010420_05310 [Streptomyces glaucosporus]|uniref:Uncharacterized protein n=1 Tax=Streptomyces glaucosporus TaxID=284044 RepID=A0ABN3HQI5_9ACTN